MTSEKFEEAFQYAAKIHASQVRKGTEIPYISHLMAVAGLVMEHSGTEEEIIAGLLHDAVEDCGGKPTLDEIEKRFGSKVASIVDGCTETYENPKPPWKERKETYIAHMKEASPSVRLVACADKIHNIRTQISGYRQEGEIFWKKFRGNKHDTLWFYSSVHRALKDTGDTRPIINELGQGIFQLKRAIEIIPGRKQSKKSENRQCPECKSKNVIPIVYGLIDDPDAIKQIKNGEFATGGCSIDEDSPKWQCRDCNKEFGKIGNI